jgi:hypothetical protein
MNRPGMDRRGFFAALAGRGTQWAAGEPAEPEPQDFSPDMLGDLSGDMIRLQAQALGLDPERAGRAEVLRAMARAMAAQRPPETDPGPGSRD